MVFMFHEFQIEYIMFTLNIIFYCDPNNTYILKYKNKYAAFFCVYE